MKKSIQDFCPLGMHGRGITFSMFVCELVCLYKPKNFIDVASNRQVIHDDLTQDSLRVNDEESSASKTEFCIWLEY